MTLVCGSCREAVVVPLGVLYGSQGLLVAWRCDACGEWSTPPALRLAGPWVRVLYHRGAS